MPPWASESAGAYTVQARATDKAGNTFTGSAVSFTLLSNTAAPAGTVADTSGASSLQITNVTSAVGRTQFVEVAMEATTSNVTVTDSAGNTYAKDADVTNTGNVRTLIFSARVTSALSGGTITIN